MIFLLCVAIVDFYTCKDLFISLMNMTLSVFAVITGYVNMTNDMTDIIGYVNLRHYINLVFLLSTTNLHIN